jgi:hypothetical protein
VATAISDALRAFPGVLVVAEASNGLVVRVADRDVVPRLVQALVERGVPVFGASAHAPTLEDVYFAVEARIAASEGRVPVPIDLLGDPVDVLS